VAPQHRVIDAGASDPVLRGAIGHDEGVDLTAATAQELSAAIADRSVSCREVMAAHLDRIEEQNPEVNAIISLRDRDELMAEAAVADEDLVAGRWRGWMHGFPHAVKDLAEAAGLRTTLGSPLLSEWVPTYDALQVARIRAQGAIIIAKTNVPEFGLGSHTFNPVFGTTRNAVDPSRTAGGSSGGAAVALATGMVPVADGSDFMGSLRNPAAFNSVVGYRPSQGRVPAYPMRNAYTAQCATEGPMARNVADAARLLGTQAGWDPRAPLSIAGYLSELATADGVAAALQGDPAELRIGWLGDLSGHLPFDPGVLDICAAALHHGAGAGVQVVEAGIGIDLDRVWTAWLHWRQAAMSATISAYLGDTGSRALVKDEALWEMDSGAALTAGEFTAAAETRTRFYGAMMAALADVDVLAVPSAQVWPFPVEQRWPERVGGREMDTYHRWMEVTLYATFAGLPAVSLPVGRGDTGLPMGIQLIGHPLGDVATLRAAAIMERILS